MAAPRRLTPKTPGRVRPAAAGPAEPQRRDTVNQRNAAAKEGAPAPWVWPGTSRYLSGWTFGDNAGAHRGIDIGAVTGSAVYAPAAGVVRSAGPNAAGYGNLIVLDTDDGYRVYLAHLADFNTRPGARVAGGQLIGFAGSTGNSSGPHIHMEVRTPQGGFRNPFDFYPDGGAAAPAAATLALPPTANAPRPATMAPATTGRAATAAPASAAPAPAAPPPNPASAPAPTAPAETPGGWGALVGALTGAALPAALGTGADENGPDWRALAVRGGVVVLALILIGVGVFNLAGGKEIVRGVVASGKTAVLTAAKAAL